MFVKIILFAAVVTLVWMLLSLWFPDKEEDMVERMESFKIYSFTNLEKKMNESVFARVFSSVESIFIRRFGEQISKGKALAPLQVKIHQAGMTIDPIQFRARRFIYALLFGAVAMLSSNYRLVILCFAIGLILPDYLLRKKLEARKMQINEQLPEFTDLLAAVFPGCNNLDEALSRICSRMDTIISREFQRVLDEINANVNKREALRAMALRCGTPAMDGLITKIIQTEMLGTEMAETLTMQSNKMRELKKQTSEKKAKQAAMNLLFPSMFLVITILIVIMGPSIIQTMDAFKAF